MNTCMCTVLCNPTCTLILRIFSILCVFSIVHVTPYPLVSRRGYNALGQVGDGTKVSVSSPVRILGGACSIAAGHAHSLALVHRASSGRADSRRVIETCADSGGHSDEDSSEYNISGFASRSTTPLTDAPTTHTATTVRTPPAHTAAASAAAVVAAQYAATPSQHAATPPQHTRMVADTQEEGEVTHGGGGEAEGGGARGSRATAAARESSSYPPCNAPQSTATHCNCGLHVMSWGLNNCGQLGDGTYVARTRPTRALATSDCNTLQHTATHCNCGQLGDRTHIARTRALATLNRNCMRAHTGCSDCVNKSAARQGASARGDGVGVSCRGGVVSASGHASAVFFFPSESPGVYLYNIHVPTCKSLQNRRASILVNIFQNTCAHIWVKVARNRFTAE